MRAAHQHPVGADDGRQAHGLRLGRPQERTPLDEGGYGGGHVLAGLAGRGHDVHIAIFGEGISLVENEP